jgi:hypothetical protein
MNLRPPIDAPKVILTDIACLLMTKPNRPYSTSENIPNALGNDPR